MKKTFKNRILLTILAMVLGGFLMWLILPGTVDQQSNNQTIEELDNQTWTCSMHPQVRRNEPGDCPICGMDLIPVDQEEGTSDPNALSMSPTAMQLANVQTATVEKMQPAKTVRLEGKVQADERLRHSQSSHIPGRIEELNVSFTGETVRKGQVLASIYSPDLVTAQNELLEAQQIKESQPQLFRAAKSKLKNWKLSENQIQQILNSGEVRESFPIRSDVTGTVIERNVSMGDYVTRGEPLYRIADLSRVWILLDVYESDLTWVQEEDEVEFSVSSMPGETFEGTISYIDPVIDPQTRVAQARIEMPNPGGQLKPEMFVSARVEAELPNRSDAIAVPKSAVMWTGRRSVVYVMKTTEDEISFKMREVTLGPALGESYIIEEGLKEGEEIVIYGTFSVDAAAQLAGKPSMMAPERQQETEPESGRAISTQEVEISDKAKRNLMSLIEEYLNLKSHLANDNLENAKSVLGEMKEAFAQIDMNDFEGEAHVVWMGFNNELEESLDEISAAGNIREVRDAFFEVSDIMIDLAATFKPNEETLYIQHCPMADSNKGADWLSEDEEIRNPYFGASMLKCGEVTSTID